jgi:hypothetical protein
MSRSCDWTPISLGSSPSRFRYLEWLDVTGNHFFGEPVWHGSGYRASGGDGGVIDSGPWCVVTTTETSPGILAENRRLAVMIQRVQVPSR